MGRNRLLPLSAAEIWSYLTAAATTAASLGKLLGDNVNATMTSRQATLSFTRYYDASLAASATYTPAQSGLYQGARIDVWGQSYLQPQYYSTALTAWYEDMAFRDYENIFIGDATNMRIKNADATNAHNLLLMRMK